VPVQNNTFHTSEFVYTTRKKIAKGSLHAKEHDVDLSFWAERVSEKFFSNGLIRQLRAVSAYQAHSMYQRRLDKVMCTKYQIVELAKESLPVNLL